MNNPNGKSFWTFNFGHLLTLLSMVAGALVSASIVGRTLENIKNNTSVIADLKIQVTAIRIKVDELWFYKTQGIDFKKGRELGIVAPKDDDAPKKDDEDR